MGVPGERMTEESYATLSWNQPPVKFNAERRFRGWCFGSREGVLVLTGMPRPILGESCTTSIKDFDIFPPHKKKNEYHLGFWATSTWFFRFRLVFCPPFWKLPWRKSLQGRIWELGETLGQVRWSSRRLCRKLRFDTKLRLLSHIEPSYLSNHHCICICGGKCMDVSLCWFSISILLPSVSLSCSVINHICRDLTFPSHFLGADESLLFSYSNFVVHSIYWVNTYLKVPFNQTF